MKIIGGLLCKNEEKRWLTKYLQQMEVLCDELVVLDDKSTDRTIDLCFMYGANIHSSYESMFDIDESELRKRLWNLCAKKARENDWIIILDADELFNDEMKLRSILKSPEFGDINLVGFKLYDMWTESQYRYDKLWNAHERYWLMCVRYHENSYHFNASKLHCGRWPNEIVKLSMEELFVINGIYIKHMGWSTYQDRLNKYNRYIKLDPGGKFGILEQYNSILDVNPNLITL
jgi:glycosyltransferase involved in cell wall biosynthesis